MDEFEFAVFIDCDFPYNDRLKAIALIDQANSISANAMFIVLEELCRPGQGVKVTKDTLLSLIDIWSERTEHPLAQIVVPVARLMAKGSHCWPVDQAAALMEKIAPFKGLYSALNVAYFSCDDVDELLEVRWKEIHAEWEA